MQSASSAGIDDDLDLLPGHKPARRAQTIEDLEAFGLIIVIGHAPREGRDGVAARMKQKHRLYRDRAPVEALQDLIERAVRG